MNIKPEEAREQIQSGLNGILWLHSNKHCLEGVDPHFIYFFDAVVDDAKTAIAILEKCQISLVPDGSE